MKSILVSGGTGQLGRFIVNTLLEKNSDVTVLCRNAPRDNMFSKRINHLPFTLGETSISSDFFRQYDGFVHAAFDHVPGKYRDGEGDDPLGFRTRNVEATLDLFKTAKIANIKRAIFLSSRAVYGKQIAGLTLYEETPLYPDTLYGKIKLEAEKQIEKLADKEFLPVILRPTGVYGALHSGDWHKWSELFTQFEQGKTIDPRAGTEVHGYDLAKAVYLVLKNSRKKIEALAAPNKVPIFNVSDFMLDRRMLLEAYASKRGLIHSHLPVKTDAHSFNQMDCSRLKKLGWQPRGALDLSFLESKAPL